MCSQGTIALLAAGEAGPETLETVQLAMALRLGMAQQLAMDLLLDMDLLLGTGLLLVMVRLLDTDLLLDMAAKANSQEVYSLCCIFWAF